MGEGAAQDSVTLPSPGIPDTPVGFPGALYATAALDQAEYAPTPALFTAATRNMYDVPATADVICREVAALNNRDVVHVPPPSLLS